MYLDHVTIHVPPGVLDGATGLETFFDMLGFTEVEPEEEAEGLRIRWFKPNDPPQMPLVHLVEGRAPDDFSAYGVWDQPVLGHFAIACSKDHMEYIKDFAAANNWLSRDNAESKRFWLRFANVRVEVRPL